jgi:uncharacterized protein (DUF2384 family)
VKKEVAMPRTKGAGWSPKRGKGKARVTGLSLKKNKVHIRAKRKSSRDTVLFAPGFRADERSADAEMLLGKLAEKLAEPTMRGGEMVRQFRAGPGNTIVIDDVADSFGMSKLQLAETAGFSPETFQRAKRAIAPKTQHRVQEMLEIIGRVVDWAGGPAQAMAWYRAEPLPSFGGRTAESLVKDGKAAAVRDYLDRVAMGGFA